MSEKLRGKIKMFSDEFLESLIPDKNGKYDIREKTGRGFSITIFPSGKISFIFFYHYNGRKRRMTLGKYPYISIKKARKLHEESLVNLEDGIDPAIRIKFRIIDTRKSIHPSPIITEM